MYVSIYSTNNYTAKKFCTITLECEAMSVCLTKKLESRVWHTIING